MNTRNVVRKIGLSAAALLAIALLAMAAFVGVRLVQGGDLEAGNPFERSVQVVVSSQVPSPDPEISGVFIRRQDNRILIGTGNIQFETRRENNEEPVFTKSYDGPEVELVISRETEIYCDVPLSPDQMPSSGQIQQRIERVSEDAIREDQLLWAWGEREGDRFLARFVLIFNRPGGGGC